MLLFNLISWLVIVLLILLSVAFFTLFERKLIGLVHFRVGPNNVSFQGLFQPLLDAFKLLSKSYTFSSFSNKNIYFISPYVSLMLSVIIWVSVPLFYSFVSSSYSLLLFICIGSMGVFSLLLGGWSSNSKYSFVGCMRAVAQSISYESVFTTLVVVLTVLCITYSVASASYFSLWVLLFVFPIWLFTTLAETHRAPFDFSESESELVSGFNTEYSGSLFAFLFLSEYSIILASSTVIAWLFFGYFLAGPLSVVLVTILISSLVIFIRVTYCRYRYDLLIIAAWKSYLPVALSLLLVVFALLFSSI